MNPDLDRRTLLKLGLLGTLAHARPLSAAAWLPGTPAQQLPGLQSGSSYGPVTGWGDYPTLVARIRPPVFPPRDFPITQFGAVPNGSSSSSASIARAIDACAAAGGGRVVVPAGTFLTGPITLKSRVNLHVSEGATLRFSTNPADYPRVFTRFEGVECMNYSPLIYAFGQDDVAVSGRGTLDGQAARDTWWAWKLSHFGVTGEDLQRPDSRALNAMGDAGTPVGERVFGAGHTLRPSFIQFYRCRNILIEDVTILRSPMWEVHPVLSSNVTVRRLTITSHGPNNDGCNPESCRDVLIEDCVFDVGDDCIAIKSGRNTDGRRVNVPSENIIVRRCTMKDGHGGVVLGSECSGHIRNVFVEDCSMDSPNLDRVLRFKNNAVRGGTLENVFARNITVGTVREAVLTIDLLYEEGANGPFRPTVRNVQLDRVTASAAPRVMYVVAFAGAVIDDILISNCVFKGVESTEVLAISGRVEFRNTVIEPKNKPQSLSTRPGPV